MAIILMVALCLAFWNGANDNFKGFATAWGSETLSYRKALLMATLATVGGSLMSMVLAHELAQQFSGKGLLPDAIVSGPRFLLSVGIGAALTVVIATRAGLPISTTHALIGGLVGAGLAASPNQVQFGRLWNTFLLPLLFSPIVAALMGMLAYRLILRPLQQECVCVQMPQPELSTTGEAALSVTESFLVIDKEVVCDALPAPVIRWSIARFLDHLHSASAALICFARGVNDTPKLAALLIAANLSGVRLSVTAIAIAMAVGGLLFARRVAETMSRRVTRMNHTQGVAANLITAVLVLGASQLGWPVSTTHVSVGSIAGVGAGAHTLNWETLRNILLSWIATLPLAAGTAWVAMTLF
ncbi:inorganic phosphate transporter [Massilia putida]|uniref:inorganic phosphate transporter n=1 Tax=Massilia putida TaxID=1141883 RepID=UPI000951D00A|nr:inorganic phosphate transporter [Massilia putida]